MGDPEFLLEFVASSYSMLARCAFFKGNSQTSLPFWKKCKKLLSLSSLSGECKTTGVKALYSFHHFKGWSMVEPCVIFSENPLLCPLLNIIQYRAYTINQSIPIGYVTGYVRLLRIVIFVSRWSKRIQSRYFLSPSASPRKESHLYLDNPGDDKMVNQCQTNI